MKKFLLFFLPFLSSVLVSFLVINYDALFYKVYSTTAYTIVSTIITFYFVHERDKAYYKENNLEGGLIVLAFYFLAGMLVAFYHLLWNNGFVHYITSPSGLEDLKTFILYVFVSSIPTLFVFLFFSKNTITQDGESETTDHRTSSDESNVALS